MSRSGKLHETFFAAGLLVVLMLGFAGPASAGSKPKFVYATNSSAGNVSGYAIDAATGVLTPVPGSPFTAGSIPYAAAVDPSGKFLFVTNRGSNNVSAFSVDGTTGALSPVSGSPFAAGTNPYSVAIDPSDKFVYVANQGSNNVSAYTLDGVTGALTAISGSPFAAQIGPVSVTVDPLGKFVYVTNGSYEAQSSFNISGYAINTTTGALAAISGSPFLTGYGPVSGTVVPSGKFLYEIFSFNPYWGVDSFTINGTTGALTPIIGCHAPCGDSDPTAAAIHPSGKFLYVTDNRSSYIAAYAIDSTTGQLGLLPGSPTGDQLSGYVSPGPYATGSLPNSIAIDPSGKFAYVGNMGSNSISGYAIDGTTGALNPILGSPFATGGGPSSVAIVGGPSSVAFETFKVKVDIDEDRRTSFRVAGFFTLGKGNDGINPVGEAVQLQVGTYSVTIPANSFREHGKREFSFDGWINDVSVRIRIEQTKGKEYLFTAEGKGNILKGIKNPVTVGLVIGDDEGSATVKADIDK